MVDVRRLELLHEGEKFRVAHPDQVSKNGIRMSQDELYSVERVYPMTPHMRVCKLMGRTPDSRIRTLMPDVPTLKPREPRPSRERVEAFVLGRLPRRKASGYSMLWDGEDVGHLLQPQELTVLRHLRLFGRRDFAMVEITEALASLKLASKMPARKVFNHYARHYCELGLLREFLDETPRTGQVLRDLIGA